jgi:hypothetical protein
VNDEQAKLEDEVLSQKWFYRYRLPSGRETQLYVPDDVELIHRTRTTMMMQALQPDFEAAGEGALTAIDFSSHQGFFSLKLAERCRSVLGLEYQQRHVDSARLIARTLSVENVRFEQEDLEAMPSGQHEPADIVINFGLMYNLENPIAVLRRSRELTKRVLLIETQATILDLEGAIDSGHHDNTNYKHGYYGLFSGNPENIDGAVPTSSSTPALAG